MKKQMKFANASITAFVIIIHGFVCTPVIADAIAKNTNNLDTMTRQEFVSGVIKAVGLSESRKPVIISDVDFHDKYYGSISSAYQFGIAEGYVDGSFRPLNAISRQESMAIVERALNNSDNGYSIPIKSRESGLSRFIDGNKFGECFIDSAETCVRYKIVIGDENGKILPNKSISRNEIAAVMQRLAKIFNIYY